MGLQHLFLLRQHELVVEHQPLGDRVQAEEEAGKIGRGIDCQWHHAEPQRRLEQRGARDRRAAAAHQQPAPPCQRARDKEGQPRQHGDDQRVPFRAHRQPQRHAGQRQPPTALFGLADRGGELPCGQREEAQVEDVEHGDARVHEQVETGRQQHAIGKRGEAAFAGEPQRAHGAEQRQRAQQRGQQPPADGIVAEQRDAERDQLLAQQRVFAIGKFVQRQQLARGGEIVNLVEIGMRHRGQMRQAGEPESQREHGAPAKRILDLFGRAAHREPIKRAYRGRQQPLLAASPGAA